MTVEKVQAEAQQESYDATTCFVWPLGTSTQPDEMNTSYGPRVDADRWDFHDGIDLPAAVGTQVHAMAAGTIYRAGPADNTGGRGYHSTHVVVRVTDPVDGENDLFLVYLHLDSIADGIHVGGEVEQGDLIGIVGQEDATYPHLHFEFRKTKPLQPNSLHPLRYLPYENTANFTDLRLDRCNFYTWNGQKRAVRMRFKLPDRREGDVQGVDVELRGAEGVPTRTYHVDFDDRQTIVSDKGDNHAFKNGIAVEGYQRSNLEGDALIDLQYGVIVRDISREFTCAELYVHSSQGEHPICAEVDLPELKSGERGVHSVSSFEGEGFPPSGWQREILAGNVCRPDLAAKINGDVGLLCEDRHSSSNAFLRAGLRLALPVRTPVSPMSWRVGADIRIAQLEIDAGQEIYPLAFMAGGCLVAAACVRKIATTSGDKLVMGVIMRSAGGLLKERIDVTEGAITEDTTIQRELELIRIGTRQTTAVLRWGNKSIARVNGDTTAIEPDSVCAGIMHRECDRRVTLHFDQLLVTESLR